MSAARSRTARIAELNDRFRRAIVSPLGMVVATRGIASLTEHEYDDIWSRVRAFEDFTPDNDPYGEHDFGSFAVENVGKVFWKIDYYADRDCHYGSEDPSDPEKSFRVLTIMLASEY